MTLSGPAVDAWPPRRPAGPEVGRAGGPGAGSWVGPGARVRDLGAAASVHTWWVRPPVRAQLERSLKGTEGKGGFPEPPPPGPGGPREVDPKEMGVFRC